MRQPLFLTLAAVVLSFFLPRPQKITQTKEYLAPNVGTVFFLDEGVRVTPIVRVDKDAPEADRVIVETSYHQTVNIRGDHPMDLIRSDTSVIPDVPEASVAGDPVPAKMEDIAWVKLTLVKEVSSTVAPIKEAPGSLK